MFTTLYPVGMFVMSKDCSYKTDYSSKDNWSHKMVDTDSFVSVNFQYKNPIIWFWKHHLSTGRDS